MNHKYLGRIAAVFLKTYLKTSRQALFYGLISGLLLACSSSPATPTGTGTGTPTGNSCDIINAGKIPQDLAGYDQAFRDLFSTHTPGAALVTKYVKEGGTGDGSSYNTAASNVKSILDGITDAAANKVYMVLVAPGTYDAGEQMAMKDNVVIVGGGTCLGTGAATTTLSGGGNHRVFTNYGLTNTAVLYGVTIADGKTEGDGGGMNNDNSFPVLIGVTLSGNTAAFGGGMYNKYSSPILTGVTLSGNRAIEYGGGMYNHYSSPMLTEVTFSGNTAKFSGGGMRNWSSSPILTGVTFSANTATNDGGGMANDNSFPVLIGVTLSGNSGGGMYNDNSSPMLLNTILWGNSTEISGVGSRIHYSIVAGVINSVDPGLLPLADNGGGVMTHAIPTTSPAVNQGVYVKRSAASTGTGCSDNCKTYTYYYSSDNNNWYSNPGLTTTATLPTDAVDLTATDATGRARSGRPDVGAYEAR